MPDVTEDDIIYLPIHRSLTRLDLQMGCERGPLMLLLATAIIFVLMLAKPLTILAAVIFIGGGVPLLKSLAKRDPMWYRVWTRHSFYQNEYPMHPTPATPPAKIRNHYK